MATLIDYNKDALRVALETHQASLKRRLNTEKNPMIKTLVDKDLADLTLALITIQDAPKPTK